MKNLTNFINESYTPNINLVNRHMGEDLKEYSPVIYNAFFYKKSIIKMVEEYKKEFGTDEYINWGEFEDYGVLTDEVYDALESGEDACEPEYKLLVKCAEAEWKYLKNGYNKQLEEELKSINETLMK